MNSSQLAAAILQADESNMPRLRAMIFRAEDTHFTLEEDARLAPWLLKFAEKHRNSDSRDVVYSSIRTGASMLFPKDANKLYPLLQPGLYASNVAMKMMGRIFEAQPPTDIGQHKDLANNILKILNQHIIDTQGSSEMSPTVFTILTIHALVAMGCDLRYIPDAFLLYADTWVIKRLRHKLVELQGIWVKKSVSEKVMANLKGVIETLGNNSGLQNDSATYNESKI